MRADEARTYLEIVNRAIRGLAAAAYPPEVINAWVVPITDDSVRALIAAAGEEIRLVAELDGDPVGIGALVVGNSELRACYVAPEGARRGCGSALVAELEQIARDNGLTRLELVASINAEPFYASHGYRASERCEHVLPNGTRMEAVAMSKRLA
jgi:putative acetyltransferase